MYDQHLFMQTLSRFAAVLPARYELDVALSELTESVTAVLGLCGSGITMADDGRLRFVTTVTLAAGELERDHAEQHPCPCREVYSTGEVVLITDLRKEPIRWPEFSATARRLDVAAVAGIPMRLADQIIGSLNLYSTAPRQWSAEDIDVASVLADVATSYVVNASKLRQLEQLSEQLQEALESRVVIEQAKGIIAQQQAISVDQAFQLMRSHARSNSASLRTVAEAIVSVGLQIGPGRTTTLLRTREHLRCNVRIAASPQNPLTSAISRAAPEPRWPVSLIPEPPNRIRHGAAVDEPTRPSH